MEKKIGQIIEERLRAQNVNVTEFAKKLHTRRENVYDIFKRENIDIELLKKNRTLIKLRFFSRSTGAIYRPWNNVAQCNDK